MCGINCRCEIKKSGFLMAKKENADNTRSYLKKVLILVLIVMAVTLMVMFVGQVIDTLLVIFAGILLGTILRAARDGIHRLLHIGHKLSLVVVVVLFLGIISSAALLLAPDIRSEEHTSELQSRFDL